MNTDIIKITKKPGIKNCIRINSESDIPVFLKEVIKIENNELILDCLEGIEKVPVGSVIAYEKLESGKMNVWNKANWKETTYEVDGVFYEIPKQYQAIRITNEIPQDIIDRFGDKLNILPSGGIQINTNWGISTCEAYNGYIIIYGVNEDNSLNANILTKGTPSFEEYFDITSIFSTGIYNLSFPLYSIIK